MADLRTFFINSILALIFGSILILVIVTYQASPSNNIPSENRLTSLPEFSSLNSSINALTSNSFGGKNYTQLQQELNSSANTPSFVSFGWVIWNGVIAFGQLVIALPIALYSSMSTVVATYFGIPSVYIDLLGIGIVAGLIALLYRFWRQGQ